VTGEDRPAKGETRDPRLRKYPQMSKDRYFHSIEQGDVETLKQLLRADPALLQARRAPTDAHERPDDCTGLHAAVHAEQLEAVRVLLDAGIDVEACTSEGRTALHDAIEFGQRKIEMLLLERGARVDICAAAILGRIDRLRELLDSDAELVNDRSTGLSPLGWAAYGNQCDTANELIARGARMDDGELLCAASVGHTEVGRVLLQHGIYANAIDPRACGNALHAAVSMKYTYDSRPFVEMLIEAGVDLQAPTLRGKTALQIAEARELDQIGKLAKAPGAHRKSFAEVADLLRRHGA
jgi:ankyrin repeat protein